MKVSILYAAISPQATQDELDTLAQVEAVEDALRKLGHQVSRANISLNLTQLLEHAGKERPDIVFNLVESVDGLGEFLYLGAMILDRLEIPYTGANTAAIFSTSNKLLAKNIFQGADIPTAPWISFDEAQRRAPQFSGPYIIKNVWEHASVGLDDKSIVYQVSELAQALVARHEKIRGQWFAEKFIAGREFNQSMIAGPHGPQLLPLAEMRFENFPEHKAQIVDYRAKWIEGSFEFTNTLRSFELSDADKPLVEKIQDVARRCWEKFELRGYARVDFRVDEQGQPWVLEVNANPCIAPDSGFVAAAARAGLDYPQVVLRILEDLNWHHQKQKVMR